MASTPDSYLDREQTTTSTTRPLAVVTGGTSGIGLELAKLALADGYDVVIAADSALADGEDRLDGLGGRVEVVQADLATPGGNDKLVAAIGERPVAVLCANAGHGLGHGFLDQPWDEAKHVIDTNVTGTLYLIQQVARRMRDAGSGRILITGSEAGYSPGAFQAVYHATKAFIDSFAIALREELKDSGVSVTLLMPGATETEFFHRAGLDDTKVGQSSKDPADAVAKTGWDAMKSGRDQVVHGAKNKLRTSIIDMLPRSVAAKMTRSMNEPGLGNRQQAQGAGSSGAVVAALGAAAVVTLIAATQGNRRRQARKLTERYGYEGRSYEARGRAYR